MLQASLGGASGHPHRVTAGILPAGLWTIHAWLSCSHSCASPCKRTLYNQTVSDDTRPNPDALLAAIQKEDARVKRGKLKVFFGMAPGVGKTYAMLEAARRELAGGREVVVGLVETHGRKETDALTEGLPVIPRLTLEYRGVTLTEMDLDAVLARRPQLALVDEFAHTNAPGSRHPKRFQDVLELLDAGIDVFTTLNVQHVESRADAVRQITGATIRETVPDTVLDGADFELVDLPPEELRARLTAGKVYLPESARAAQENFFRPGNLSALRELALRFAAEHVGQDVLAYRQAQGIADPWKSGQRLLVAVSASPTSAALVRWTRRLAGELQAPWLAVYVELPKPLAAEEESRLVPSPCPGPRAGRASGHHHRRRCGARPSARGAGTKRHPARGRQTPGLAGAGPVARRFAAQPADSRERPY